MSKILLVSVLIAILFMHLMIGLSIGLFANFRKTTPSWLRRFWWDSLWFIIPLWPIYIFYFRKIGNQLNAEYKAQFYWGDDLELCDNCDYLTKPRVIPYTDSVGRPVRCYYCNFEFPRFT